jgi:DNA helicase-4
VHVEVKLRLHQAVQEFQATSRELEKAQRRKLFRNILKLILIGFFIGKDLENKISQLALKKDEITESIEKQVSVDLTLIRSLVGEIQNSGTYLIHADKEHCISSLELLETDLTLLGKNGIFKQESIDTKKDELRKHHQIISDYNRKFVEQRRKDYSYLWNKVLLSLDEEQQVAVVTDDKHNLVIAAAGSGKTEVLITRIAYLIARKPDKARPNRILAIAYTNKAKEEIEQRLLDRYNIEDVNIRTFHKLGKDILEEAC